MMKDLTSRSDNMKEPFLFEHKHQNAFKEFAPYQNRTSIFTYEYQRNPEDASYPK